MAKRRVAKKKAAKKKLAGGKKAARGKKAAIGRRKMRAGKKDPGKRKRKRKAAQGVQPRVWRRAARLAQDALAALDEGNLDQVRQYLRSIQAVAECADRA